MRLRLFGLACLFLAPFSVEAAQPPPKRKALDPIEPIYPTITPPPSTRIKDGVWKETPEYGVVRYTKGEKPQVDKDGNLIYPGKTKASLEPTAAESAPPPGGSDEASTIDLLPLDPPSDLPGKKESLPPGPGLPWRQAFRPEAGMAAQERPLPAVDLSDGLEGQPQAPGALPATPYRQPDEPPAAQHWPGSRQAPNRGVAGRLAGGSETFAPMASIPAHERSSRPDAVEMDDAGMGRHTLVDLIALLGEGSPRFRARVADELGRRGEDAAKALPALTKALDDPSSLVKASAALALGNIGGDPAIIAPKLTPLLKHKNPDVRMSAQTALGRLEIGPSRR